MNFVKKIKAYFSFSKKEMQDMLLVSLAIAFMFSFKDWGEGDVFDAMAGFKNLFNAFLISGIAVLAHESMHKVAAAYKGYACEHKPWWTALFFGIMLTFVTRGNLFFFGFGVLVYHLARERLGTFRYGFNLKDVGFISLAGPIGNILLVVLFKIVFMINASPLAEKAMLINILFAAFNMLPIPWVDGGDVFFSGRIRYIFFIAMIGMASLMLYLSSSIIISIVLSIVIAAILAVFWALGVERMAKAD